MRLLPAHTSIGVKLALRYGLTLLAALSLFALGVGSLVERRINGEAELALRFQVADLVDDFHEAAKAGGRTAALEWLAARAVHRVEGAQKSLGLGIELVLLDGTRPVSVGSLEGRDFPIDRRLVAGSRASVLRAVNLGDAYAYLILTEVVDGGFIRVALSTERFAKNVDDVRRIFLWSVPVLLLVAGGAGWFLSRSALAPIARINAAAREIGSNEAGWLPTTGNGDELDRLASTLNEMVQRIRTGVDRLSRFSGNAAHELRSPLNRIVQQLDQLAAGPSGPEIETEIDAIRDEVTRMTRRIDALLRLARIEQGLLPDQAASVDMTALVDNVASFFEPESEDRGIDFVVECAPGLTLSGDAEWLSTALSNLVSNAIKFSGHGGRVRIHAVAEGTGLSVSVSDTGPGIPESESETIFERFERASGSGHVQGFGLGLPIAREIARAHGGDIRVSTKVGAGSTFTLVLPTNPRTGSRTADHA